MAVSVCNECRGKISTNAEVCPHCGNKITKDMFNPKNVSKMNGVEYDFTPLMADMVDDEIYYSLEKRRQLMEFLRDFTACARMGSFYLGVHRNGGEVPKEFYSETIEEMLRQSEAFRATQPKCPTCGSINIHEIGFGERTLSVNLMGLSSKKFNKTFECNKCGYTW